MDDSTVKRNALPFWKAALVRALKTAGQTAAALLSPALTGNEVDLLHVGAIALVAGLYSIVTSLVTGLPEVVQERQEDGTLVIDVSVPYEETYKLLPNTSMADLANRESVRLLVRATHGIS